MRALQTKFYRDLDKATIVEMLSEEKARAPNRIPYFVSPVAKQPGTFTLSYMTSK